MKVEVKTLMSENEMLSHVFLGCIPNEQLLKIKDEFIGKKDWEKESVKIPVELKIGGISVNPKAFFDSWRDQMQRIILEKAQELVAEKLGSKKMRDMQDRLSDYERVLESWEKEINWQVENPLIEKEKPL